MAKSGMTARKIPNGTYGSVWVDDERLAECYGCQGKMTISSDTINLCGQFMEAQKPVSGKGTGSLMLYKADSGMIQRMEGAQDGDIPECTIGSKLADPASAGAERIAYYGVQFTDKGAYMYVLETLSVEDFINQTGIQVSIKNEVNEVLDILQGGKQQDYVNSGAFVIINNVLDTVTGEQSYAATVAAARTVDSAAQLATVAGTQTLAWDMLQTRSDSTQRHLDSIKTCRPTNCTFGPIFCICTTAVTVCGLT